MKKSITVNAFSDIFVRFLLGDEKHTDILLSFINSVHSDNKFPLIKSIIIKNPFNLKNYLRDKESIIDVKALDEKGIQYDIEVQVNGNEEYKNRSLYYWAKLYTSQINEGDIYKALKPAICINLITFELFKNIENVHSCFMIKEINDPDAVLTNHLVIHFLELEKFYKQVDFKSPLEKWLAYFKYEGNREDIMEILIKDDPVFKTAHEQYRKFTADEELMDMYEARMKWQSDYKTSMHIAREEGFSIGCEQGRAQGFTQTIKRMLEKGIAVDLISDYTGISIENIMQIKQNNKM